MKILLTNDDSIHAAGLAALHAACVSLGHDPVIVAPAVEQSQCGHRVTTHSPLEVVKVANGRYTVAGTPADCVRVALFGLGIKPDLVLSGVNHGGNMGQDIHVSGTCAAAREACYHGIRAMAFSHYIIGGVDFDWPRISRWVAELLPKLLSAPTQPTIWTNVNFPHLPPGPAPLPEVITTKPERQPLGVAFQSTSTGPDTQELRYTARYSERLFTSGSDVAVTFGGNVSVTMPSIG